MKFEILAPAGSMESLIAGVRSGANAVYLGGKLFNARRNAGNFDNEELKKAVEYCHNRMVKVYLAINILISDREMQDAYNAVRDALYNSGYRACQNDTRAFPRSKASCLHPDEHNDSCRSKICQKPRL